MIHITGAAGYFAGNFIYHNKEYLTKNGCKLYDIRDLPKQLKDMEKYFVQGDITKTFSESMFNDGDILINFASNSHVDYSFFRPDLVIKNNQAIGDTILELRNKKNIKIIHISTDEITTRSSPYSDSKYYQEQQIKKIKNNVIILRFNNLYGNNKTYPIIQNQPCIIPNTIRARSIVKQGDTKKNSRNFMFIGNAIDYVWYYLKSFSFNEENSKNNFSAFTISEGLKQGVLIFDLYYGRTYKIDQIHKFLIDLFKKYNTEYRIIEIPDRKVNDVSYPSLNMFDEAHGTFLRHLEETFNFIINNSKEYD